MKSSIMKGKVYLLEGASGDPDLLPIATLQILRGAEIVLYDDHVSPKFLEVISASAQVRNVHKLGTYSGGLQEKILSLLISAARQGHNVLRLKASGPFPPSQTDEEIEALAQADVDFEVIPGAASAVGAAAGAAAR